MSKVGEPSPEEMASLQRRLKQAKSKAEYRRVQCVWLRVKNGMKAPQIAAAVGLSVSRVRHIHSGWRRLGEAFLDPKPVGGRRHENLTVAQEVELLEALKAKAASGGILVVGEVHRAYEARVGHPVPAGSVYRMLHRHGWRKVQPRPRHREADPQAQEDFKKSSARSSRRRSRSRRGRVGPSG